MFPTFFKCISLKWVKKYLNEMHFFISVPYILNFLFFQAGDKVLSTNSQFAGATTARGHVRLQSRLIKWSVPILSIQALPLLIKESCI